jgi:putative ABC transport system permease protein
MFGYYLDLALRSLKRSPGLTALMVLSIGVGVALAMSSWTLVHLMSRDPLPEKSAQIYFPTIDAWGPAAHSKARNGDEPPDRVGYATATELLREHRAEYQSVIYTITPTVTPHRPGEFPFNVQGYAVTDEFFPMVDAPFVRGSAWSAADEAGAAQVAVITATLSEKLFGTNDSVGKTIVVNGREWRVAGVMANWNPQPVFFNIDGTQGLNGFAIHPAELYLPFNAAVATGIEPGGESCFKDPATPSFASLRQSTCVWLSYMVQLGTPAAAQRYKDYLEGFARQRFSWPPNVRLRDLMAWLAYEDVVPSGFKVLRLVGSGLLIVCLVDTIGLMLAKFLRRSGEIGVRRALGAPRRAIYAQFLTEATLVGVAGGVLGIVFTWLAMQWMRARYPSQWNVLTQLDANLLALTLLVAVSATLLAALYPVWRAAHVQPAWQIKSN